MNPPRPKPATAPRTGLGGLTPQQFLERHWQKRPLLIRRAYPDFRCPLSPEELAGLACEEGVEGRIVLEKDGTRPWEVRHGPFEPDDFAGLPESHWTLLVQEVNRWVPELAALLDDFDFVPTWRIDDLMVSYAAPGGSVGPHTDSYDVFLLQGHGRRRWQIDTRPQETCIPDLDLRILERFEAEQEWILEPGDMLYLPPEVAHYGVALDPCMTLSVGFRAPSARELVTDLLEATVQRLDPGWRYNDPCLRVPEHPGQVDPAALERARRLLRAALDLSDEALNDFFAAAVTAPQRGEPNDAPEAPLTPPAFLGHLRIQGELWRCEGHRLAYRDRGSAGVTLYVDGQGRSLPAACAAGIALLTGRRRWRHGELAPHLTQDAFARLLSDLYNQGVVSFSEEP
jgi:50S ribosomal protein L16 3-hydroxylase